MELVTVSSENERAESESRKMYRVETFIIPKGNKVFYSTKELDLESHDDKEQPNDVEMKLKEQQLSGIDEKGPTASIPEAPQSRNPKDGSEFDLQYSRENLVGFNSSENGVRMGDEEAVAYLEESLCCGGGNPHSVEGPERAANDFKVSDEGEFDPFLGMKCLDFTEEEPRNIERSRSYDFLPSQRSGSDLKSIKESNCETTQPGYGSCEELCHHGNRNGCTVVAQSPNKVSEVIFKENWMKRLELLRRRVSLIREKEVILQERERLLLKKEKELRILERLIKEKIQRADLYLKRCTARTCHSLDEDELDSRPSPPPYPDRRRIPGENEMNPVADNREIGSRASSRSNRSKGSSSNSARSEPSVSIGHQEISRSLVSTINAGFNGKPISEVDRCRSKWSAYASWRCRAKPKVCYEDLDSTLSADIGDSSFAITSKKLDPRLVRRPQGFARSASERGPKSPRPRSLDLDADRLEFESGKVLRKISENISAVVLSQGTRFQDYGSIDRMQKLPGDSTTDVAVLRVENKADCGGQDQIKSRTKEKTSFWNEEASDWLQKKRQAYNLANKRMANRDYENDKENFGKPPANKEKPEKIQKLKNDKGKKFTIFR